MGDNLRQGWTKLKKKWQLLTVTSSRDDTIIYNHSTIRPKLCGNCAFGTRKFPLEEIRWNYSIWFVSKLPIYRCLTVTTYWAFQLFLSTNFFKFDFILKYLVTLGLCFSKKNLSKLKMEVLLNEKKYQYLELKKIT